MNRSTIVNILMGGYFGGSLAYYGINYNELKFWVIIIPTLILIHTYTYFKTIEVEEDE